MASQSHASHRTLTRLVTLFASAFVLLIPTSARQPAAAQTRPQQSAPPSFFTLDPTFGQAGVLRSADISPFSAYGATVLLRDSNVLLATSQDDAFVLKQYLADGSLDPASSATGVVTTTIGENAQVAAMARQADGAIIVVGTIGYPSSATPPLDTVHRVIARYTSAGQLDLTFGSNGIVLATDAGMVRALYVHPDGKIIVAGISSFTNGRFWLARYLADGTLDASFGNAGVAESQFNGQFTQVGMQPNGQIVAVGSATGCGAFACDTNLVIARYSEQGVLDDSFGENGFVFDVRASFNQSTLADLVIDSTGRLIIAVRSNNITLVRYTADGQPDQSFGSDGITACDFGSTEMTSALAALDDGGYVVAGFTEAVSSTNTIVLARFSPSGAVEATGISGIEGYTDYPAAIAPQPDGTVVVIGTGYSPSTPSFTNRLFQARYVTTPATQRVLLPLMQQP